MTGNKDTPPVRWQLSLNAQIFLGAFLGIAFGIILGHAHLPSQVSSPFFSVLIF